MEGEDKELWSLANASIMSDQETDNEGPVKQMVFHRPDWRSERFNELVRRIDESLGLERFYSDEPSRRKVDLTKLSLDLLE